MAYRGGARCPAYGFGVRNLAGKGFPAYGFGVRDLAGKGFPAYGFGVRNLAGKGFLAYGFGVRGCFKVTQRLLTHRPHLIWQFCLVYLCMSCAV